MNQLSNGLILGPFWAITYMELTNQMDRFSLIDVERLEHGRSKITLNALGKILSQQDNLEFYANLCSLGVPHSKPIFFSALYTATTALISHPEINDGVLTVSCIKSSGSSA